MFIHLMFYIEPAPAYGQHLRRFTGIGHGLEGDLSDLELIDRGVE